ncbi:MAG: alpha-2-macroglobulin family protein, partial [Bacteroidia bacterium]|nr:alpha-2-macroglobulin family protein [Bacteroidia bacterium]
EGEVSIPSFGGSFYSPVRDEAIALNALLETDPDNSQIGLMAKHISEALKNKRYMNTQERSFSFLAMGKIARKAVQSYIKASIKKNNKEIAAFDNKTLTLTTKELNGTDFEISTQGTGQLYYFWEAEGISSTGEYKEEDSYMKVRKEFYDRNGYRITDNTFKQNDLIVIKLSIVGEYSATIENVVISDILPAGFEIENPRITETSQVDWVYKDIFRGYPEYQDIRDDRMNLFVTVTGRQSNYYYMVRTVSKGKFKMGPVGADAMYNGEYHSYNGAGTVVIY